MDTRARRKNLAHAVSTAAALAAALVSPSVQAIEIGTTSYASLAEALAAYTQGNVIDIGPDDSGVLAVSAAEVSGKAINFEAGTTATLLIDVQYAPLTSAQPRLPLYNISGITVVGEADPEKVWDVIEVTGSVADKFKLFWSNQDAQYYTAWPTQSVTINEVGVQIGNLYASYLAGDGPVLLDTVQTRVSGTENFAARRQSLHDNILGNLGDAVVAGRFPGQPDPRSTIARTFGTRPVHDGTIVNGVYSKPTAKTALSWDLAAGIDYFDDLPSLFGNTIAIGSTLYGTVTDAVTAATPGALIRLSAGNFTQSATLNLGKDGLTLQGAGRGETIITSQASGYGILWTANDITLRGLSFNRPAGNPGNSYGLKVQPAAPTASQPVQGVNILDVTVFGWGRSEIDLHYVDGALLRNVTANGNNTDGAGVALTASQDVTLENVTTSGNAWGAVAVYTKPGNNTFSGDPATSSQVTISNLVFDEAIALFGEGDANSPTPETQRGLIPGLAATQFTHTVRNATYRTNGARFTHYRSSAADAQAFAAALHAVTTDAGAGAGAGKSVVTDRANGHFIVGSGLAIQAAVDAADPGGMIAIGAGTYAETVKISKPLTLAGSDATQVTLAPASGNGIEILGNSHAGISGVTLSGMTVDAPGIGIIALSNTSPADQYDSADITIEDIIVRVDPGDKAGIGLFDVDGATLDDITITGHDATAVGALEMIGVRNIDITGLVVASSSRSIKLFEVDDYAPNGSVTIRDSQLDTMEIIGSTADVDAKQNWWGTAVGPVPAGQIIGDALFQPWAVDAAGTALSSDAAEIELASQPGNAQAGASLAPAPVVRVIDHEGNPVAGISITAQLAGGGTLGGTTTLTTSASGTATFSNLVVGSAGSFTLNFSAPGLASVASTAFTISAPPTPPPLPEPTPLPEPEPEPGPVPTPVPEPEPEPELTETLEQIVGSIVIPPPQPGTGLSETVVAAVNQAAAATTELAQAVFAQINLIDTSTAIDALSAIGNVVKITGAAASSNATAPDAGAGAGVISSGTAALDSFSTLLGALDAKTSTTGTPAALSDVQKDAVREATVQATASAVQILVAAQTPEAKRVVLETLGEIISSTVNLGIALSAADSNTLLTAADSATTPDADTESQLQNSVPLKPRNSELISREQLDAALAGTGISVAEVENLLAELGHAINPADVQVGGVDGQEALMTAFTEALGGDAGMNFVSSTGTAYFTTGGQPSPQQGAILQPVATRRMQAQTLPRTIPARIVSSNVVSSTFPDGILTRPDGSVVITSNRIAALVVPAPHDPIHFFTDLRSFGNVALDAGGNVTIVRPGVLHFSATFDFRGSTPGGTPVPLTALVPSSRNGTAADPDYAYTVIFRDGTTQVLQPFVEADAFVDSLRQLGLAITTSRDTGIITAIGERFRPAYLVRAHTTQTRAWWEANKDASGLAYRALDVNGDGRSDFEVHSATGVQIVYRLARTQ